MHLWCVIYNHRYTTTLKLPIHNDQSLYYLLYEDVPSMSQDNEDGQMPQQINDQGISININTDGDGMHRQHPIATTAAARMAPQQPQPITSSTNNAISTTTNTNDTSTKTRRRPPPRRVDHTYREYSKFPMNELPSGKKDNNFPAKVHRILSLPEYASVSYIHIYMPYDEHMYHVCYVL